MTIHYVEYVGRGRKKELILSESIPFFFPFRH